MKIIKVLTCNQCPYIEHTESDGYSSELIRCRRYSIILCDWDGPENFDFHNGIHPDCKLEDKI